MLKFLLTFAAILLTNVVAFAEPITLQLNWKPEPQFGGFYTAQVEGIYKQNGLDVKVEPGGAGTPTVQMVAAGKVPYAVVSADELVIARSRGLDVVALFAVYQVNPQGIMTRESRGLSRIADVFTQPGVLAMQKGLPYALFLEKKFGFGNVQIVPSPFGDLTAYRTREDYAMQCFITSEPLAAAKIGIVAKTFLIAEAGYNPYTTVLVTTGERLKRNADEVTKVTASVRAAWVKYLEDPTSTNEFMRKLNPTMDAETFAASAEAQKHLIETDETRVSGIGTMTLARWSELIDQLADLKVIQQKPDPKDCFVEAPKKPE
jgi:NitT/TauT family transport system substrate-binding protein